MSAQKYTEPRCLIVIVGPTGSGKSSLSISLAEHYGCPIISTDSRQFYRGIPIGTAQPSEDELSRVEHHFIANRELDEDYNAGAYEQDALATLDELFEHHKTVVAVGGSGLYIKALCEGLDELPEVSNDIRESVRLQYAEGGLSSLLDELRVCDEEYYSAVDRNNPARVMRAVELCRAGGVYSQLRSGVKRERDFKIIKIGIDLPREELYDRINRRVDEMVLMGLETEVRSVYPLRALNSLQSVGYRELFDYFDGAVSYDAAIELIKRNSRRYAKRQMTWFRRDLSISWVSQIDVEDIIKKIEWSKKVCE